MLTVHLTTAIGPTTKWMELVFTSMLTKSHGMEFSLRVNLTAVFKNVSQLTKLQKIRQWLQELDQSLTLINSSMLSANRIKRLSKIISLRSSEHLKYVVISFQQKTYQNTKTKVQRNGMKSSKEFQMIKIAALKEFAPRKRAP